MSSYAEQLSESSLPSHPRHEYPSSPPLLVHDEHKSRGMDENPTVDPAPPPIHKADALPPVVKRVDSNETERPPSAQQRHDDRSDEHSEFMSDDDPAINDPAHRLPAFDWEDLHARYHAAISKCQGEEDALMQEFQNLMTVPFHFPLIWMIINTELSTSAYGQSLDMCMRRIEHIIGIAGALTSLSRYG